MIADIQDERGQRLAAELGARAGLRAHRRSREADARQAGRRYRGALRPARLHLQQRRLRRRGRNGSRPSPSRASTRPSACCSGAVLLGMKHAAPVMKRQAGVHHQHGQRAGLSAGFGPMCTARPRPRSSSSRAPSPWTKRAQHPGELHLPGGIATRSSAKGLGMSAEGGGRDRAAHERRAGERAADQRPASRGLAQAALWLASDDSTFVNGHALVVTAPQRRPVVVGVAVPRAPCARHWGCRTSSARWLIGPHRASVWPPRRRGERHARQGGPHAPPSPSVSPWPPRSA